MGTPKSGPRSGLRPRFDSGPVRSLVFGKLGVSVSITPVIFLFHTHRNNALGIWLPREAPPYFKGVMKVERMKAL